MLLKYMDKHLHEFAFKLTSFYIYAKSFCRKNQAKASGKLPIKNSYLFYFGFLSVWKSILHITPPIVRVSGADQLISNDFLS